MLISQIIEQIRNESSSNGKLEILMSHKDNPVLKDVFEMTYNPKVRFYLKGDRLDFSHSDDTLDIGSLTVRSVLSKIADRQVTGNAAIELAQQIVYQMQPGEQEIFIDILNKDQRCGVSTSTVNKVWPGIIEKIPLMKCADEKDMKAIEGMTFPAYCQLKVDAARCVADVSEDGVTLFSSGYNEFTGLTTLQKELADIIPAGYVVDGELIQKGMDRKKSNGIANKAVKGTITPKEADNFQFVVWDIVPRDVYFNEKSYSTPYKERFKCLSILVSEFDNNVKLVESHIVNDFTEADAVLKQMWSRGEEGTILKSMDGKWENRRSRSAIKFKEIKEADLVVTDVVIGTGKNAHRLGNIVVQSADGEVTASVGSGFDDEERDHWWTNRDTLIGKIVTVAYNQRVDNSLFLPRFVEVRHDKNEADSSTNI